MKCNDQARFLTTDQILAILQDISDSWDRDPYINELEFIADDAYALGMKSESDVDTFLREMA